MKQMVDTGTTTPDTPLITIITVVLNGAAHLERAIQSILSQGYTNLEYIVIDGGSTDGTIDLVNRYIGQIDYFIAEPDNGIYDAMNKGLALANGELIAFLNADDYYQPGTLNQVATIYSAQPEAAIYYGDSFIIQEDLGLRYLATAHTQFWRGLGFTHQAIFVHRKIYQAAGRFDIRYRLAADYDFVLRALSQNTPLINLKLPVVNYSNTGLSGNNLLASLSEIREISAKHNGLLSLPHLRFLLLYAKSFLLSYLERLIGLLFGGRIRSKARTYYLKKFIIKDQIGNERIP